MEVNIIDVEELSNQLISLNEAFSSNSISQQSLGYGDVGFIREIKRYLSHIFRTPLPLDRNMFSFKRWVNFPNSSGYLDVWLFIQSLYDYELDKGIIEAIRELGQKYQYEHPTFGILSTTIRDIKNKKSIIVVHKHDVIGLKFLVHENCEWANIEVTDWNHLGTTVKKTNEQLALIIIEPPYDGDLFYQDRINEINVIGPNVNNLKVKKAIDLLITSRNHPYFLNEEESAPKLLLELERQMRSIEIIKSEFDGIPEIKDEMYWSFDELFLTKVELNELYSSESNNELNYSPSELIVAFGDNETCVFFPPHSDICWKDNTHFGIESAEKLFEKGLQDICIYLSKNDLPIKVRFIDWLINEIPMRKHMNRGFIWDSFEHLVQDSVEWTCILRDQSKLLGDDSLAKILSESNLTAKSVQYIKKWWQSYELPPIVTSTGELIHIPIIEHPRNHHDLRKIGETIDNTRLQENAKRYFCASLEIQKIRKRMLKMAQYYLVSKSGQEFDEHEELVSILDDFLEEFKPYTVHRFEKVGYEPIPLHKIIPKRI
jgi:hypothetical protein